MTGPPRLAAKPPSTRGRKQSSSEGPIPTQSRHSRLRVLREQGRHCTEACLESRSGRLRRRRRVLRHFRLPGFRDPAVPRRVPAAGQAGGGDKECRAMIDGRLMYRDSNHLSYDGDVRVGERFARWLSR
ncbi:SGNH hydrolase domain-containing protein [Massilia sp. WF1]|uniref:SGNH hydrolase domain-containing protein n=2 Tax=unclassified Massilia TaxID=2609279 RepID=UPI001E5A618E|nr:SGNH hydrolase domain-containing protein [Massilia sp. WF1]